MAPVLGRGGSTILYWEERSPRRLRNEAIFSTEEAGLWEVYSCGERNDYYIEKQTGSEQEAVEELYQIAKYEYESALRHLERERQRKRENAERAEMSLSEQSKKGKRARFPFLAYAARCGEAIGSQLQ